MPFDAMSVVDVRSVLNRIGLVPVPSEVLEAHKAKVLQNFFALEYNKKCKRVLNELLSTTAIRRRRTAKRYTGFFLIRAKEEDRSANAQTGPRILKQLIL